jgi:S1-C subfamily serine protease
MTKVLLSTLRSLVGGAASTPAVSTDATASDRAWLGLGIGNVPSDHGVLVCVVQTDSPAHQAGLEPQDVIISLNGQPLTHATHMFEELGQFGVGHPISLVVERHGQRKDIQLTLGQAPEQHAHTPVAEAVS